MTPRRRRHDGDATGHPVLRPSHRRHAERRVVLNGVLAGVIVALAASSSARGRRAIRSAQSPRRDDGAPHPLRHHARCGPARAASSPALPEPGGGQRSSTMLDHGRSIGPRSRTRGRKRAGRGARRSGARATHRGAGHGAHRYRVLDRPHHDGTRRVLPARCRRPPRTGSSTTPTSSRSSRSTPPTTRCLPVAPASCGSSARRPTSRSTSRPTLS